jgi:very-short-patch-repair endonuclease
MDIIRWKNNEHFIRHQEGIVFYDFCIPDLKIIIEFNGAKFHPNKNKLSEEDFNQWTQLLSKQSAEEVYKKDMFKMKLAKDNGYDIFIVWENDNFNDKINELKFEINNKLKKS